VDHTQDRQATVGLADDPAGHHLPGAVEPDVGGAGVRFDAGRQGSQDDRLAGLAQPQQDPAGLLVAAAGRAVPGIFPEQRTTHPVGEHDALQG